MAYFDDKQSLYEVLGLSANASPSEVIKAYERILGEIETDYLALYSMVDDAELAGRRRKVQLAFDTLTDPGKRATYDGDDAKYPSLTVQSPDGVAPSRHSAVATPFSSAESSMSHTASVAVEQEIDGMLLPEKHNFAVVPKEEQSPATPATDPQHRAAQRALHQTMGDVDTATSNASTPTATTSDSGTLNTPGLTRERLAELTVDREFSGALLRTLRETAGVSLDDMATTTKISKRYLRAIEADDYATLPAKVYTNGFVTQYARVLGLDAVRVAKSFLALVEQGGGGT